MDLRNGPMEFQAVCHRVSSTANIKANGLLKFPIGGTSRNINKSLTL